MRAIRWWVPAWIASLLAGALAGACQDYKWSPNASPVCNETVHSTVQPIIKSLDILFVIDNSGTMREEQQNIAANFQRFADKIIESQADYQIGIITTDVESGKGALQTKDGNPMHKIINQAGNEGYWTDQMISNVFQQNIVMGTGGTSFEKGLEAVRLALSSEMQNKPLADGGNQGFLRDDSTLGIVFISDENDCSHPNCPVGDETCIGENDPLFECDDKSDTLTPVAEYYDFLVDEDAGGPVDTTGIRPPKKIIVAGIIGQRDETQQNVCIRTKQGEVRELDVACWPIDPTDKVPPEALGDNGRIYDENTTTKQAKFSVPPAAHTFTAADQGKWVRVTGANQQCNNGVWSIVGIEAGENAAYLQRSDDLWEEENGLFWEMGLSPGMATDSSRYAQLISMFPRGLVSTICTFEWDETLERLGATFTLQFHFCLGDPPAGLEDLLAQYANPEDACPAIEELVKVKVNDVEIPCNDGTHPWYITQDMASCSAGSGYKVYFPTHDENARRQDCALETPTGGKGLCYPKPGDKAEVFYLSQEGNSDRCTEGN